MKVRECCNVLLLSALIRPSAQRTEASTCTGKYSPLSGTNGELTTMVIMPRQAVRLAVSERVLTAGGRQVAVCRFCKRKSSVLVSLFCAVVWSAVEGLRRLLSTFV